MSVEANITTGIAYTRTVEGDFVSENDDGYSIDGLPASVTLNADSTPPVTDGTAFSIPLSTGAVSINLAALPADDGVSTINGTGLKVQSIKLRNPATNAGAMTIVEGASNGHPTFGAAFSIVLQPGQSVQLLNEGVDVGTDIGSGDRLIDVTGTGVEELEVSLVVG